MDAAANPETLLLRLLEAGDVRRAAHVLVTQHADEVYGLCRAMIRDGTEAEDLSQDVFAKAFEALPRFRGEASVRTWILRITRNACIDHLRAKQREPWSVGDEEPDAQVVEEPSVADLLSRRESITRALDALEENERALVVLRFGHGLGYPELADAFALKQGTVRMRISRALTKMRAAAASPETRSAEAPKRKRASTQASPDLPAPASQAPAPPARSSAPRKAPAPPAPAPVPSGGAPGAPPPAGAPPMGAPQMPAAASAPRPANEELGAELHEASLDGALDMETELDDDATVPVHTEGQARSAEFGSRTEAPPARGGSRWFGWLSRLFARDRGRDPASGAPTPPEAPPESAFTSPPPDALRARLEAMAASVE